MSLSTSTFLSCLLPTDYSSTPALTPMSSGKSVHEPFSCHHRLTISQTHLTDLIPSISAPGSPSLTLFNPLSFKFMLILKSTQRTLPLPFLLSASSTSHSHFHALGLFMAHKSKPTQISRSSSYSIVHSTHHLSPQHFTHAWVCSVFIYGLSTVLYPSCIYYP